MIVDCGVYERGVRIPDAPTIREALKTACERTDAFVWLGLHEPTFEEFEEVQEIFDLHPLAVEVGVHAHQRP